MKKVLLLTSLLLTLFGCSNELEFNEHTLQVTKDNEFWKATDFSAKISEDGFLKLVGTFEDEVIALNIESTEIGSYSIGTDSNTTAWYTNGKGGGFTTEYKGNGEVVIEKFDPVTQTFTGSFRFNAFSPDGEVVNFINGIFYQVPIADDILLDDGGELKASVDNEELEADEVQSTIENGMIEVVGRTTNGSYIKLVIPQTTTAGSHNLNEQSDSGTYAIYGYSNGTTSTAQFGTLFISEHNIASGLLRGTFTFTTLLPNSVTVENGNFKANY